MISGTFNFMIVFQAEHSQMLCSYKPGEMLENLNPDFLSNGGGLIYRL